MNSKFPYILAIILGLTFPFIPEIKPFSIIIGLIYFFGGSLFGFLWPKESWRWGIWFAGPTIILLGLSVLFAGQLEMFLKKDLPILFLTIISTSLGGFLFAWFRNNRTK